MTEEGHFLLWALKGRLCRAKICLRRGRQSICRNTRGVSAAQRSEMPSCAGRGDVIEEITAEGLSRSIFIDSAIVRSSYQLLRGPTDEAPAISSKHLWH